MNKSSCNFNRRVLEALDNQLVHDIKLMSSFTHDGKQIAADYEARLQSVKTKLEARKEETV